MCMQKKLGYNFFFPPFNKILSLVIPMVVQDNFFCFWVEKGQNVILFTWRLCCVLKWLKSSTAFYCVLMCSKLNIAFHYISLDILENILLKLKATCNLTVVCNFKAGHIYVDNGFMVGNLVARICVDNKIHG